MSDEGSCILAGYQIAAIIKNRVANKITAGVSITSDDWFDFARDVEATVIRKMLSLQLKHGQELQYLPDKGPWAPGTTGDGRAFLESDDFEHDVRLYIDGDFADADEKRRYASSLADMMNLKLVLLRQEPVEETDEQQETATP